MRLLMLLLLSSCGGFVIDSDLQPEANEVIQALGISPDFDILNKRLSGKVGFCRNGTLQEMIGIRKQVHIDLRQLKEKGISIKLVLLHEIGHCNYRMPNRVERYFNSDGCVVDVMMQGGKKKKCESHFQDYVDMMLYKNRSVSWYRSMLLKFDKLVQTFQ